MFRAIIKGANKVNSKKELAFQSVLSSLLSAFFLYLLALPALSLLVADKVTTEVFHVAEATCLDRKPDKIRVADHHIKFDYEECLGFLANTDKSERLELTILHSDMDSFVVGFKAGGLEIIDAKQLETSKYLYILIGGGWSLFGLLFLFLAAVYIRRFMSVLF